MEACTPFIRSRKPSHAWLLCLLHCCAKVSHADCLHDYVDAIVCLLPAIMRPADWQR